MDSEKYCPRCGNYFPATPDFFYPARPRRGHKSEGWQSHCKNCWRVINREAYMKRKAERN